MRSHPRGMLSKPSRASTPTAVFARQAPARPEAVRRVIGVGVAKRNRTYHLPVFANAEVRADEPGVPCREVLLGVSSMTVVVLRLPSVATP